LQQQLIRFVVVDEIHLVCSFGKSFRNEFQQLKNAIFSKLPAATPHLFLTATCTQFIISSIQNMFGINMNSIHWPSPNEMAHRNVRFHLEYTNRNLSFVTKTIKEYLLPQNDLPNKIIVYSNRRNKIIDFAEKLDSFLDSKEELYEVDTLTLVGTLTMDEKAQYIKHFMSSENTTTEYNIKVLCATSGVGNAGIDSPDIRAVYRIDFPPSILDLSQEKGRAGRNVSATADNYVYNLCISIESFMYVYKRINDPTNTTIDATYRLEQEKDLFQVGKLLTLSKMCFSKSIETMLGNPNGRDNTLGPCMNCPNCNGVRLIPQMNKLGVKEIMFDLLLEGNHTIHKIRNLENIVNAIKAYPSAPQLMFSKPRAKQIYPMDIKKVIFVLVVSKIIKLKIDTANDNEIVFSLARSSSSGASTLLAIQDEKYWEDISIIENR
jgi:superfamily II DNA helicase RecQ